MSATPSSARTSLYDGVVAAALTGVKVQSTDQVHGYRVKTVAFAPGGMDATNFYVWVRCYAPINTSIEAAQVDLEDLYDATDDALGTGVPRQEWSARYQPIGECLVAEARVAVPREDF